MFNLDKLEFDSIVVGQKTDFDDGVHTKECCSFFVKNGFVKNLSVVLGNFYSDKPVFKGNIQINGKLFKADNSFSPELVLAEFKDEIDSWNDGVEINHQFAVGKLDIEFSWRSDNFAPNYIFIDIQ